MKNKISEWVGYTLFALLIVYTFSVIYFAFQKVESGTDQAIQISYQPAKFLPLEMNDSRDTLRGKNDITNNTLTLHNPTQAHKVSERLGQTPGCVVKRLAIHGQDNRQRRAAFVDYNSQNGGMELTDGHRCYNSNAGETAPSSRSVTFF